MATFYVKAAYDSDRWARISGYDEGEADVYLDGRTALSRVYFNDGKRVVVKI